MQEIDSTVDLKYDLPETKFDHIFKPSRHVNFLVDVDAPVKNLMGQTGGTMPNYYQLLEELQSQIATVNNRITMPKQSFNPNLSIHSAVQPSEKAIGAFTSF